MNYESLPVMISLPKKPKLNIIAQKNYRIKADFAIFS